MKHNYLNLTEGSFPIKLSKVFKNLSGFEDLGEIKDHISTNITLEKFSKDHFRAKGNVVVTFKTYCQTCFKKTNLKLNIETEVEIKDIKYENVDESGPSEIHYQDLENFIIDDLVAEEIYLNFPSIVTCGNNHSNEQSNENSLNKVKPFQKIRDLIK